MLMNFLCKNKTLGINAIIIQIIQNILFNVITGYNIQYYITQYSNRTLYNH